MSERTVTEQSHSCTRATSGRYLLRCAAAMGVVAATAVLAHCARQEPGAARESLSMGTSSVGSAFYTLAVGMSDYIARDTGIGMTAEPIGGSDANLRALSASKIDLAMLNADSATAAFQGAHQFSRDGKVPVALIAQGQLSLRQIVARAAAGIRTPADLAGKRFIMRRKALNDIETVGRAVLASHGVPESSVRVLETAETNEAIDALKVGSADAALIPGGVPASFLSDLSQSLDVVFVSIAEDKLAEILAVLGPAFRKGRIPSGTYRGQSGDILTPAVAAVLVARADVPADTVYRITKALFARPDRLAAIHSAGRDWTIENSLTAPPLPFHPGAARYYKEKQAWRPDLAERP